MAQDDRSRRDFIGLLLGGGTIATLSAIVYPITKFLIPPPSGEANVNQVKLSFSRADLETLDNRSKTFKFGRTLGVIVLTEAGDLKAMAATCTHLDCTVQHRRDLGIMWCACHNGRYDLEGRNISGPPPRPLESYLVNEVGEDIFVSRKEV